MNPVESGTGRASARRPAFHATVPAPDPGRAPPPSVLRDAPLLCASPAFSRVLDEASRAARASSPILLVGESGTGKGRVARYIHESSGRPGRFVVWSAPETVESLAMSDLFGHRRGAFTGADDEGAGLIPSAHGGTILADDVDKLNLTAQSLLLRFLDDHSVRPLGSPHAYGVDVRIVAATNRDLLGLAEQGRYLPDLASRLVSLVIEIPPLRERREDIPLLARHFAAGFAREYGLPSAPRFEPEALRLLTNHTWPANVRGLASVIQNAVFRASDGVVDAAGVLRALGTRSGLSVDEEVRRLSELSKRDRRTESVIRRVTELTNWNGKKAAELLGIPLRTFRRLTRRYGIRKRLT